MMAEVFKQFKIKWTKVKLYLYLYLKYILQPNTVRIKHTSIIL